MDATKFFNALQSVVQLAKRPELVLKRFGLIGDTSEAVDDAWDEVTEELATSLDTDLRKLVYDKFLQDHDFAEFGEE
jgi:DNA-binding ferritin-like protein